MPNIQPVPIWAQSDQFSRSSVRNYFSEPYPINRLFGEPEPPEELAFQDNWFNAPNGPDLNAWGGNRDAAQRFNRTQTRSALNQYRGNQIDNSRMMAAGISAGGNLLGQIAGGGFGLIGESIRNAHQRDNMKLQHTIQEELDKERFEIEKQRMDIMAGQANSEILRKQNDLATAGLPSYLATMGSGALSYLPRQSQRLPGGRLYTSQLPGDPTTSPWQNTPIQTSLGWGKLPTNIFQN